MIYCTVFAVCICMQEIAYATQLKLRVRTIYKVHWDVTAWAAHGTMPLRFVQTTRFLIGYSSNRKSKFAEVHYPEG